MRKSSSSLAAALCAVLVFPPPAVWSATISAGASGRGLEPISLVEPSLIPDREALSFREQTLEPLSSQIPLELEPGAPPLLEMEITTHVTPAVRRRGSRPSESLPLDSRLRGNDEPEQLQKEEKSAFFTRFVGGLSKKIKNSLQSGGENLLFDGNALKDYSSSAASNIITHAASRTLSLSREMPSEKSPETFLSRNIGSLSLRGFSGEAADLPEEFSGALNVNPKDEREVERALRDMIDADPARYKISSADLVTVYVTYKASDDDRADTIHAYFRQKQDVVAADGSRLHLPIWGAYLAATIKVVNGKPQIVLVQEHIEPNIKLPEGQAFSDKDIEAHVREVLRSSPGSLIRFLGRAVMPRDGRWQAVNLYRKKGLDVTYAADILSGEVFSVESDSGIRGLNVTPSLSEGLRKSWARKSGRSPPGSHLVSSNIQFSGQVLGRAETDDHRPDGKIILSPQPLPYLTVTIGGEEYTTDENGRFEGEIHPSQTAFKAKLSGRWTEVLNEAGEPVEITGTIKPGQENVLVFNPEGEDPLIVDQVNAYIADSRHRQWARRALDNDRRLDYKTIIRVNTNEFGNAWYSHESGDIHADQANEKFSDTGRLGILFHEMTHKLDDMIHNPATGLMSGMLSRLRSYLTGHEDPPVFHQPAGIVPDEGLGEGWGDIFSMFMLGTSLVGEGFFKKEIPNWIREGDNPHQYNPNDGEHDKGQVWMGFAWKLRKSLIEKLGEQAGAAMAESLIIPVMLAYAPDIPSAIFHVLLNAMDKNGHIHHEDEIRAAAKAHGVDLSQNPGV